MRNEEEHSELGKRIIESLEEAIRHARGEDTGARVTYGTVPLTARKAHLEMPPYYPPHLVRDIRQKLSVSQAIFAQMLGVSASTVRAWEQGKREAEGPVGRLLQIAEMHPDVLRDVCGEMIPATPGAPRTPRAVRAPAAGAERLAAERDST
jgi:putative transcriptional regulator